MATRRSPVVTTIKFDGPFFTKDPAKTFRQNIRVLMDAAAAQGQADVQAQMRAGNAGRAPIRQLGSHTSEHVVGRTRGIPSRGGHKWQVSATVSINNSGFSKAQGISLMAAAASVESRIHAFRKTRSRMGRTRKTNVAELMKGVV